MSNPSGPNGVTVDTPNPAERKSRVGLICRADAQLLPASCVLLSVSGHGILCVGSQDPNRFYPGMGTLFLRWISG